MEVCDPHIHHHLLCPISSSGLPDLARSQFWSLCRWKASTASFKITPTFKITPGALPSPHVKRVRIQTKCKTEIYAPQAQFLKVALVSIHRQSADLEARPFNSSSELLSFLVYVGSQNIQTYSERREKAVTSPCSGICWPPHCVPLYYCWLPQLGNANSSAAEMLPSSAGSPEHLSLNDPLGAGD